MSFALQFRLTQRHIRKHLFQSILFVIGIALGVAVGIAIDLANASASRAFELSVDSVTGRTTHQIVGSTGRLSTDVYRTVRIDLGIRSSAPIIDTYGQAISLDNRSIRFLGVDPFADVLFRDYLVNEEADDEYTGALYDFIATPNTVLISADTAARYGLALGDTITVRTPTNPSVVLTIIGFLYPNDDLSAQALDDLLLMDIATAQEISGQSDTITRIDLILPPDADLDAINSILPPGTLISTPANSQNALSQMTDAFKLNLQALSLLALLVGVFLIYNTVSISVVQRRPVIGILRSLGMTRPQIFLLILTEVFVLGLIGTLLGLILGVFLGRGAVQLVAQTINDLYFRVNVQALVLDNTVLIRGAMIGITASIVASVIPSFEATRTQPVGVMRRSNVEQGIWRVLPYIVGVAIVTDLLGFVLLRIETTSIILSFMALMLILIGSTLLTPFFMVAQMRSSMSIMGRLFGIIGRMAPRAIERSLSRTSVAVAALTLAVSVIVGVSVMISSFRTTLTDWLETTLSADIFISPQGNDDSNLAVDIEPTIIDELMQLSGVERVATVRNVTVVAPDFPELPPVNLSAIDTDLTDGERDFAWNIASDGDYWQAMQNGNIIVSEPFAFRRSITRENNTITLLTEQGEQSFTVVGVFYDYSADQGIILMYRAVYTAFYNDPYISAAALDLLPDVELGGVLDVLQTETLLESGLEAQSNRALKTNVLGIFDRTFAITVALRLLATVVAFIGILSTLMALQLENTRQYGVMRANGMTLRQLRSFTYLQTGLMGLSAGILALPIGLILSLILIYVINVRSFGWTMELTLNYQEFGQALMVAVVAALTASIYPAWRLSKLVVAEALRSE